MNDSDGLITIADWLRYAATRFASARLYYGHGTDNAWDEAVALVRGFTKLPHDKLEFVLDARLTAPECAQLHALMQRRIDARVPVPYLTGEAYFAHRRFLIEPGVLIPRSPIAELIESEFAPWLASPPELILDLCAGSGCIGIACALQFPAATVYLSDSDPRAADLAHRNVELHGLVDRVHVLQGDLFDAIGGKRFDLIVTNPPYVSAQDFSAMPEEYRHEPSHALAAGGDGLDVARRILSDARSHLTPEGLLVGEVGASAHHLAAAYPSLPFIWPDLVGGGDGVFIIEAGNLPR